MTEGRKSRWGTCALFSAFAALAIIAAFPAVALATPAADEYDLNLPEADGQSHDPAPPSAEDSSPSNAPSTPSPAPEPATEDDSSTAGGAAVGSSGGGGGSDGGATSGGSGGGDKPTGSGGDKPTKEEQIEAFGDPLAEEPVTNLAADSSDGGGISMPLILLAIAAAACAGIAFWRLRRSKDDSDDQGLEPGARSGDVARGTPSP